MNSDKLYPYIFIDKTPEARVKNMCIYTDIFSQYKILIRNAMKVYVISEADFNAVFDKLDSDLAAPKNANQSTEICETEKSREGSRTDSSSSSGNSEARTSQSNRRSLGRFIRSRALERQIERVVHKYKKRSRL